ncbi:MAG: phage holin family protein [Microscillaceae bacterium]|nr:phage holin family protein [Microscillaceae bacterium]MDW8461562.1 phage holin family protein [Cytophagales bacterium]
MVQKFLIKAVLSVVTVIIADQLLASVMFKTIADVIVVTLFLAIANTFVKPVLSILAFPINVMTLGLLPLILNTLIVLFISGLVEGFITGGFVGAFLFSLIISIGTFIWEMFV